MPNGKVAHLVLDRKVSEILLRPSEVYRVASLTSVFITMSFPLLGMIASFLPFMAYDLSLALFLFELFSRKEKDSLACLENTCIGEILVGKGGKET